MQEIHVLARIALSTVIVAVLIDGINDIIQTHLTMRGIGSGQLVIERRFNEIRDVNTTFQTERIPSETGYVEEQRFDEQKERDPLIVKDLVFLFDRVQPRHFAVVLDVVGVLNEAHRSNVFVIVRREKCGNLF